MNEAVYRAPRLWLAHRHDFGHFPAIPLSAEADNQGTTAVGDVPLQFRSLRRRDFFHLGAYVVPRTPTETRIAKIWCRTLNLDEVGINDRYEDIGGDSLLAASIFAEIEESLAVVVPIAAITSSPTIAQLAQVIDRMRERT